MDETKDEPYAWEAREFLRRKLIGQDVTFATEKTVNTARTYGTVWLGKGICRLVAIITCIFASVIESDTNGTNYTDTCM